MSSIGRYTRPFAMKSVDVHKSPMAVKLIFNSVFCALYAPVTSMHLEKQNCGKHRLAKSNIMSNKEDL